MAEQSHTPGRVYVEVSGLTGSGKSAVMGEIEIALKALGLTVEHDAAFQAEKNGTHADWQEDLDLYKPTIVLRERNVSRATPASGAVEAARKGLQSILDDFDRENADDIDNDDFNVGQDEHIEVPTASLRRVLAALTSEPKAEATGGSV